jgi:hypothetical protein
MANALQLRRGTTTQHNTFTGLAGEVTVDTDKETVVVHDGSTAGGFPLARASDLTNFDADTLDGKQLATIESEYQAFANTAAANVVDSAPGTLDTLNELAAALGDDANFSTTVTNSIATKMPIAGGTFTGDITRGGTVISDGAISDTGTFTLDVAGDIILDADGGDIHFYDGGTAHGNFLLSGADFTIGSSQNNGDLIFRGIDGGANVTALTLDMSAAGRANFNAGASFQDHVNFGDNDKAVFGASDDLQIYHSGSHSIIKDAGDGNLIIAGDADIQITDSVIGENKAVFSTNGAVTLYYDSSQKFETTSTGINVTGTAVTDGVTVDGTLDIEEVYEKVNLSTGTSGTVTIDTTGYGVDYFTLNQTANRTINFTNVNANLGTGQSVTVSVLMTQGGTAYYLNAYQVDGTTVTPKWSGGSAPTEGNASGIDVYTFTIIKTANATFTVLASQSQYA